MGDLGSQVELTVRRLPDGGYIVISKGFVGEYGNIIFASDTIDTALDYIRRQVKSPLLKDCPEAALCCDPEFMKPAADWRAVRQTTASGY